MGFSPTASDYRDLGRGFDTATGELRANILDGPATIEDAAPAGHVPELYFDFAENQEKVSRLFSATASGSSRFGVGRASGGATVSTFFSSCSYSCYFIGYRSIVLPRRFLRTSNPLAAGVREAVSALATGPHDIEAQFGDAFVDVVGQSAELIVKVELKTASEEARRKLIAECSGSYGTAKGAGALSSAVSRAKSTRQVTIAAYGPLGSAGQYEVKALSLTELENQLRVFPQAAQGHESIGWYETRRLADLTGLFGGRNPVDEILLAKRRDFYSAIDAEVEECVDWRADIDYVEGNGAEFASDVVVQAQADRALCNERERRLSRLRADAAAQWNNRTATLDTFALTVDDLMFDAPVYQRKTPTPSPPARGRPPKRRQNERTERPGLHADLHGGERRR